MAEREMRQRASLSAAQYALDALRAALARLEVGIDPRTEKMLYADRPLHLHLHAVENTLANLRSRQYREAFEPILVTGEDAERLKALLASRLLAEPEAQRLLDEGPG